jgi:CheY-like chemotaxis protein
MLSPTVTSGFMQSSKTILLVDDDRLVRSLIERILVGEKFKVLPASHGEEALNIWHEAVGEIDVVLTDLSMPGISGLDLGNRLNLADKTVPVVYMSGFPDLIADAEHISFKLFLQKPFTAMDLTRTIRAAVNNQLHGWTCPDCGGSHYHGHLADDNGHTVTLAFGCEDCGRDHSRVAEVLRSYSRCPFCSGQVLLAGYGFVGSKGTHYIEGRCFNCQTKVVRHSPDCPEFPRE